MHKLDFGELAKAIMTEEVDVAVARIAGGKGTTEDQQVENTAISAIFGEYGSNF